MKVLMINGSPNEKGCTWRALEEMRRVFEAEGVEAEMIRVGHLQLHGCQCCHYCGKAGKCVYDDVVNEVARKLETADGLVLGSPVYYGSANGTLTAFADRLFYSCSTDLRMKVGASVVSARRGGNTAAFDMLNKYFTLSQMPLASSCYWNQVHGFSAEDVEKDAEGLQTMRVLARNMVFLMRSIRLGKDEIGLPENEKGAFTSFCDGK